MLDNTPDVQIDKEKVNQEKSLNYITSEKALMAKVNATTTMKDADKITNNSKHTLNISHAYAALAKSMATQSQLMLKQAAQKKKT